MIKPRRYIISQDSRWYQYWDMIVMSLAIYNCLWTPLTISFDWAAELANNSPVLNIVEWIIMTFYAVDIVILFLSSYINVQTGDEVFKPTKIASRYMRGEFMIDFLATFPFKLFYTEDANF